MRLNNQGLSWQTTVWNTWFYYQKLCEGVRWYEWGTSVSWLTRVAGGGSVWLHVLTVVTVGTSAVVREGVVWRHHRLSGCLLKQVTVMRWALFQYKDLSRYGDSNHKDERSWDYLIFIMWILILVKQHIYIETGTLVLLVKSLGAVAIFMFCLVFHTHFNICGLFSVVYISMVLKHCYLWWFIKFWWSYGDLILFCAWILLTHDEFKP